MRISKQPSGGRGEYEIAENAPNGLKPIDLLDREVLLKIGAYTVHTGVQLLRVQGKRRLRRTGKTYPQVQIQTANVLLMPHPVRDEANMTGGQPVIRNVSSILRQKDDIF